MSSPVYAISTGGPETEEFLNIVPPGQDGMVSENEFDTFSTTGELPDHFADQMLMYESIVFDTDISPDTELLEYYKDARIHLPASEAVSSTSPIPGVTIRRDRFEVPHITGKTRYATMFGIGYATAQDRLFLMDFLRHLGRAKLCDFLLQGGLSSCPSSAQSRDEDQLEVAPYRESDLTAQIRRGCNGTEEQRQVCEDARAYIDGVNAFIDRLPNTDGDTPAIYGLLGLPLDKFVVEDVVAISSLVTGIFGTGGANEVGNGLLLQRLRTNFNDTKAQKIWQDFVHKHDPEFVTVLETPFPYNDHDDIDLSSTALPDPGSLTAQIEPSGSTSSTSTGSLTTTSEESTSTSSLNTRQREVLDRYLEPLGQLYEKPVSMSNALVVGARHMQSDHPVAVFGPQTSYFVPQLLVEMAVDGPNITSRGVAFAGTNMYVQLGRGTDYAWSATSSGADISDQWALKLCEPDGSTPTTDSEHYLYKGECRDMEVFTHVSGNDTYVIQLTDHGFVTHRGTVNGVPVAFAKERSTFRRETESALGFKRMNNPNFMTDGAESFRAAMKGVEATFNWFYVDSRDIAYQHSCRCPIRDPRTNPRLPTWGNGQWDWTGQFLSQENNPHAINPGQGYLVDWNGKQAPKFAGGGATAHRSQLLKKPLRQRISASSGLTRSDAVEVMLDGGTRDLKPQEVYPFLLRILEPGTAPTARLAEMRDRLATWIDSGGHRRDVNPVDAPRDTDPLTADVSDTYDHGVAVQIGDAALEHLVRATFGDTIAGLIGTGEDSPRRGRGSAFGGGPYGPLEKDWRQVLGDSVKDPRNFTYCGDGDLTVCRQRLWDAMDTTATELETKFGSASVSDWEYDATRDNVTKTQIGAIGLPNMQWVNRPTFQQVAQPGGSAVQGTAASEDGGGGCLIERTLGVPGLEGRLRTLRDAVLGTPAGRFVTRSYYRLSDRFTD